MSEWNYLPHQIEMADEAEKIIRENALVYIVAQERTGKTGTTINIVERLRPHFILVITKKRAIDGWLEHLEKLPDLRKNYTVTNYEQVHKLPLNKYDLVVLDEAHANLSMFPKTGVRWKAVEKLTRGKVIIYLSATPSGQSLSQLYNQFALSTWSPWRRYPSFYKWYKDYGIPKSKFISGRTIIDYTDTDEDRIRKETNHLLVTLTRKEIGFKHEPVDILHMIDLHPDIIDLQRRIIKDRYIPEGDKILNSKNELVVDTPGKLMSVLHQLAGGTCKVDDHESVSLDEKYLTKIKFIKETFGDKAENVLFYNYKQEKILLEKEFKNCRILQATSYAEGISLAEYKLLIIYSNDFSASRYSQRRARQCNVFREEEINVHYILDKGISKQAYETVNEKNINFIAKYFKGI